MDPIRPEGLKELAAEVVAASPAHETEVVWDVSCDRFARFASSGPTQSADRVVPRVQVRVRVEREGGLGEASAVSDTLDLGGAKAALERALQLAGHGAVSGDLVPLGGAVDAPLSHGDPGVLDQGFEVMAGWIERAISGCEESDLSPAGLAQLTHSGRAIVNSAGRAVCGSTSRAALSLTASDPGGGGAGFGDAISQRAGGVDVERVIHRAVSKGVMNRSPQGIEPGRYTVVLEPNAVSSLLLFAGYQGLGAQDVAEEASFLCGRRGEQAFSDQVSLFDDAQNEHYQGLAFDWEGTPKQRVELVKGGVLGDPVTDRLWAAKLGVANTGHAHSQPNTHGPKPGNMVLAPGSQSMDELIGGVKRGLLVTQLHYTNMIDPRDLLLTGMTRNGTFLIEDGEVTRPVKNLRFTESLVSALASVSGVGQEVEVAGALFDGEIVCPALRIEDFRFTSSTDF
ncbi:MAG: TldD/PmbA family protein [Planctomycetes bacterium]|nr:TldD/PmbA family protein [Planctomycetota bacterium]